MTIQRLCRLLPPNLLIAAVAPNPKCWRVIPQFGRVWRELGVGNWPRAADLRVPF